jgi:hypothetical protein
MPEVNQYMASPKELTELLLKSAGIREGRWFLVANFGFAPSNFGPTPAQFAPGVAVIVQGIGIQREVPGIPAEILVDASKLNYEPFEATTATKRAGRDKRVI